MMRNRSQIEWLEEAMPELFGHTHSFVVFGNRCSFTDITQTTLMHGLAHVKEVRAIADADEYFFGEVYTPGEIDRIHDELYPLSEKSTSGWSLRQLPQKSRARTA